MEQAPSTEYGCLVFDLDDTLYPSSSALGLQIVKNIGEYMIKKLGIDEGKSSKLAVDLYKAYGTTLAGLRAIGYHIDYDDFHRYVHGTLPYEKLKPDPALRSILISLPISKVVFTNSDKAHAVRALERLGIEDCFEGIICFETLNPPPYQSTTAPGNEAEIFDFEQFIANPQPGLELPRSPLVCKPSVEAMEYAFRLANIDTHRAIMFDDSIRNIQAAKCLGLRTVLVGTVHRLTKDADCALESLHNMKEALPELWGEDVEKDEDVRRSEKSGIETTVIA